MRGLITFILFIFSICSEASNTVQWKSTDLFLGSFPSSYSEADLQDIAQPRIDSSLDLFKCQQDLFVEKELGFYGDNGDSKSGYASLQLLCYPGNLEDASNEGVPKVIIGEAEYSLDGLVGGSSVAKIIEHNSVQTAFNKLRQQCPAPSTLEITSIDGSSKKAETFKQLTAKCWLTDAN